MSRTNRSSFCKAPTTPRRSSLPAVDFTMQHQIILPNVRKRKTYYPRHHRLFFRQIRSGTPKDIIVALYLTHTQRQKRQYPKTRAHLQRAHDGVPRQEKEKTLRYTARQSHVATVEGDTIIGRLSFQSNRLSGCIHTQNKKAGSNPAPLPPPRIPRPPLPQGSSRSSGQDILYPAPHFYVAAHTIHIFHAQPRLPHDWLQSPPPSSSTAGLSSRARERALRSAAEVGGTAAVAGFPTGTASMGTLVLSTQARFFV